MNHQIEGNEICIDISSLIIVWGTWKRAVVRKQEPNQSTLVTVNYFERR
ncbi:hypothetical protein TUM4644_13980 [Shewanella colwelliana]|nr:hypothetical protein [Shewanella colwelliana]GIU22169.1 hypothetical protein TUM4644_13980 [Shewanella colwelliana]